MPSRNPNGSRFESFAVVKRPHDVEPVRLHVRDQAVVPRRRAAPWSGANRRSTDVDRVSGRPAPLPRGRDVGADVAEQPAAVVGHHAGQIRLAEALRQRRGLGEPRDPGRGERHVHGPVRCRLRRRRHAADVEESVDQVARRPGLVDPQQDVRRMGQPAVAAGHQTLDVVEVELVVHRHPFRSRSQLRQPGLRTRLVARVDAAADGRGSGRAPARRARDRRSRRPWSAPGGGAGSACTDLVPRSAEHQPPRPREADPVAEDEVDPPGQPGDEVVHVALEAAVVAAGEDQPFAVVDAAPSGRSGSR